jgi:cytochrome P450
VSLYTKFDHYDLPIGPDGTPFEFFEALRDEAIATETPIGWSEAHGGFWVVTGWPEAKEIQKNNVAFSNSGGSFPMLPLPNDRPLMMAGSDDPAHAKYRRYVQARFSPGQAEALTERLRAVTNELIDSFIESGRTDLADGFTNELPARLTAIMAKLPDEDIAMYRRWVKTVTHVTSTAPEDVKAFRAEFDEYFDGKIAEWRERGDDDYMAMVAQGEIDGAPLTDAEVKGYFFGLLLGAIENTSYLLASMFWRLSWDKELRRRLVRDPALIPNAIDEFLRFYAPGLSGRLVLERTEIGGVVMEPGQQVMMIHQIENRDPREFPYPDAFIPDRSPNRHFALGLGIHRCIGMHILRVEARVMAEEFFRRIPEWELDPERKPVWRCGQVSGMDSVPIVFPPGGGYPDAEWVAGRPLALA